MDKYFAQLSTADIAQAISDRVDDYYKLLNENGRGSLLRRTYRALNKPALLRGAVGVSGRDDEYKYLCTNHLRNIAEHRLNLTINQRPYYEPKAANTDFKSQAQVTVGKGLLEYYNRAKGMENFTTGATRMAVNFAEGFQYNGWAPTGGKVIGKHALTGATLFEGDLEFDTYSTWDVIRPVDLRKWESTPWAILRRRQNKYILAARYPQLADELQGLTPETRRDGWYNDFTDRRMETFNTSEMVDTYTLFHKITEATPNGRMVIMAGEGIILFDGPLPYRDIPLQRVSAGECEEHSFGHTTTFDCLPIQETIDNLVSAIVSNNAAYGIQNILVPIGGSVDVNKLGEGHNVIFYDPGAGKPEALQLVRSAPESFAFIDSLITWMEMISGVNSVARGQPENNLRSGSAMALVQSMAIQFAQMLQWSYTRLLENTGTAVLHILADYVKDKRVALISGRANQAYLQEFSGSDVDQIERVLVDMGNPMTATVGGRMNLAELLVQGGLVQNPEQLIEVVTSGKLEPVLESPQSRQLLIRHENEQLMQGKTCLVLRTDKHQMHIDEHLSLLDNPDMRRDPRLAEIVLDHVSQHEVYLANEMAMMQAGVPPQVAATGAESAPEQISNGSSALQRPDVVTEAGSAVRMPSMPKLPNGEELPPQ